MSVSLATRILDLLMAGHAREDIVVLLGTTTAVVDAAAADLTNPPSMVQVGAGSAAVFTGGISATRITKRVVTVTQSATPAINTDVTDVAKITGLAQAITSMTSSLTGTPVDGDTLTVKLTDNGTARAITWGASFEASTVALPTTTVISTLLTVTFDWNTATSKWRVVRAA